MAWRLLGDTSGEMFCILSDDVSRRKAPWWDVPEG